MNILSKQQLEKNCNDSNMINSFFSEKAYLESLSKLYYNELNEEDKKKVDILLFDVEFSVTTLASLIKQNEYLKLKVKIMNKFLNAKKKYIISNYYDMLYNYVDIAQEICDAINTKEERTMIDLKNSYVLSFLTFILFMNDINEMDYNCYNFNKFTDEDIFDYKEVKETVKTYMLALKNSNRVYNKKEK